MNKKEYRHISKTFSPNIAKSLIRVEKEFDKFFLRNKRLKPSQYRVSKKIFTNILVHEIPPFMTRRMSEELQKYAHQTQIKNTN